MSKSKNLSIRLDEELFKSLDEYSHKTSQSKTKVIKSAICLYLLKNHEVNVDDKTEELGLRGFDSAIYNHLLKSQATIEKCLDTLLAPNMPDQDDK